jgi:hypothetical protein
MSPDRHDSLAGIELGQDLGRFCRIHPEHMERDRPSASRGPFEHGNAVADFDLERLFNKVRHTLTHATLSHKPIRQRVSEAKRRSARKSFVSQVKNIAHPPLFSAGATGHTRYRVSDEPGTRVASGSLIPEPSS